MAPVTSPGPELPTVVRGLSRPVHDDAAGRAAEWLLSRNDPGATVDGVYERLVRHKTLTNAMGHLQLAGGDLDRLTVSSALHRTLWPLGALAPVPEDGHEGRLPLSVVRSLLGELRRRLRDDLTLLIADLEAPVVVTFGCAFEAGYPGYRDRMSYDGDLFAQDMPLGLEAVRRLAGRRGYALYRTRIAGEGGQWMGVLNAFRSTSDGLELHVDVAFGGHPTGPGLFLLFHREPILERSRVMEWGGTTVRIPSPEDMLLLMAGAHRRKGQASLRGVNDAWCLLTTHEGQLDWDRVRAGAGRAGLEEPMALLVREAEALAGRPLAPSGVRLSTPTGRGRGPAAGRRQAVASLRASLGTPRALRRLLTHALQSRAFRSRVRAARTGRRIAPLLWGAVRPRLGSLCEVRDRPPASAEAGFCLSRNEAVRARMARRLDAETLAALRAVAALLPDREGLQVFRLMRAGPERNDPHRCRAFLFSLTGRG